MFSTEVYCICGSLPCGVPPNVWAVELKRLACNSAVHTLYHSRLHYSFFRKQGHWQSKDNTELHDYRNVVRLIEIRDMKCFELCVTYFTIVTHAFCSVTIFLRQIHSNVLKSNKLLNVSGLTSMEICNPVCSHWVRWGQQLLKKCKTTGSLPLRLIFTFIYVAKSAHTALFWGACILTDSPGFGSRKLDLLALHYL